MIPVWMVVTLKSYSYRCPKNEPKRNPSAVYNVVDAVLVWVGFFFFLSWFINSVVYVWDMGIPFQLPLLCSYHSLSHRAPKLVAAVRGARASKGRCSGTLLSISFCPTI